MRRFFRVFFRLYYNIMYGVKVINIEKLPKEGSFLLCSNHLNAQDPLVIGTNLKMYMSCMAKKELFKNKIAAWFFTVNGAFPVDRNSNDISAVKRAIKILKSGESMLLFPEGTRNFTSIPLEAKAGVAMIAVKAKVPVVPITINANYKFFNKISLTIGEPLYLDDYYDKRMKSEDYQLIAQNIINKIYEKVEK